MRYLVSVIVTAIIILQSTTAAEDSETPANVFWISRSIIDIQLGDTPKNLIPEPVSGQKIGPGAIVKSPYPAEPTRFLENDVIVSIAGRNVTNARQAYWLISLLKSGEPAEFVCYRNRKASVLQVTPMAFSEMAFREMEAKSDSFRPEDKTYRHKKVKKEELRETLRVDPFFIETMGLVSSTHVRIRWFGKGWLFIDKIEYRVGDIIVSQKIDQDIVSRTVVFDGYVTETASIKIDLDDLKLINALGTAQEIVVNLVGTQGREVHSIKADQLRIIQDAVAANWHLKQLRAKEREEVK